MIRKLRFLPALLLIVQGNLAAEAVPAPDPVGPAFTLQRCLSLALEHNPGLQIASTQFLAAEGRVIQLHAILYPKLNVEAITFPAIVYVQFQQTLYDRSIFPQLALCKLTRNQASINYRQILTDVLFQVRQKFSVLLVQQEAIRLRQQYVDRAQSELDSGNLLFKSGDLQQADLSRMKVRRENIKQRLNFARQALIDSQTDMESLIGEKLPDDARFVGKLGTEAPPDLPLDKLIAEALRNRSDLSLLESEKLSLDQQIQIDTRQAWPTAGFTSFSTIQTPRSAPPPGTIPSAITASRKRSARTETRRSPSPSIASGLSMTAAPPRESE